MSFETNRRFYIVAAVVVVLLFSAGLARDLMLERKGSPDAPVEIPVVIEGLDLVREVEGDRWFVKSDRVVKRGEVSDAESLDVVIESPAGTVWKILSARGKIFDQAGDIFLDDAVGNVKSKSGAIDWTAPRAEWKESESRWFFPEGLEAWNDRVTLKGSIGSMTMDGTLDVREGAVVTW
jgi:hypothetical protein